MAVHSLDDLPHLKMSPFVRRAVGSHLLPALMAARQDDRP